MNIYTSYYGKLKKLPDTIVPVAISASKPDKIDIQRYTKLQPSRIMLMRYKITNNENDYERRYKDEILSRLTPHEVVMDLEKLSGGKDVCLLCYEKSNAFCHRHIVARWLQQNSISCVEFTYDT